MTESRRGPYTVKDIQRAIEAGPREYMRTSSVTRRPFTYVCVQLSLYEILPGLKLLQNYVGDGFAKWNPHDAGTQYDYSRARGYRIALGRAIKDIAQQIAKEQAVTTCCAADGVAGGDSQLCVSEEASDARE